MADTVSHPEWHVLPAYASEPLQPLLGATIDGGASYTIVAQLKSEWRAHELADALNAAPILAEALRECVTDTAALSCSHTVRLMAINKIVRAALAKAGL
jgi:hypothetical protein